MTQAGLSLPPWVPDSAKVMLAQLWREHPKRNDRDRLHRLATYEVMKSNVWRVLPKEPAGQEGRIVEAAFLWPREAIADLVRTGEFPPPAGPKLTWQDKPQNLTTRAMVTHLAAVRDGLVKRAPGFAREWPRYAEEFELPDFLQIIYFINKVHNAFENLLAEEQDFIDGLPRITKKNARNIPELIFSPMMRVRMIEIYGDPLHVVVTALAEVVFDKTDGISLDTERSRWRAYLKQYDR